MVRHRKILLVTSIAAALVIGGWFTYDAAYHWSDTRTTSPDPASVDAHLVDLINAPEFRFAWGDGGMGQYEVLVVSADGKADFTFPDGPHLPTPQNPEYIDFSWKRAQFIVDPATMKELRDLLAAVEYWKLNRSYTSDVMDGTQWCFRVDASGKRKLVYCSNYFPPQTVRLIQFVRQHILANQKVPMAAAIVIDEASARQAMNVFSD